jgi:hypothetical protein
MYGEDEPKVPQNYKYFGYYGAPFYWFVAACLALAIFCIAQERVSFYETVNTKSVRDATIVDAWPYNTGKYGTGREQWEGTFRDNETGKFYTYEMSGGLYQKFLREKSGHGIQVQVNMLASRAGVHDAEGMENYKVFFDLVRIFFAIITCVIAMICLVSLHTSYSYVTARDAEEAQRQKLKDEEDARHRRRMAARE